MKVFHEKSIEIGVWDLKRCILPVSEVGPPELGGVALGDAKLIAGEDAVREDGLQLAEHVTEDEAELGEVAPVVAVLVEHLLLAFLEQFDGLLALAHQVGDEDGEVLVGVERLQVVLVLRVDDAEALVRVGEDVQDEGRRVLEVHALVLAQLHYLVHQAPRLVESAPVGRQPRRAHGLGEGALQLPQQRRQRPSASAAAAAAHSAASAAGASAPGRARHPKPARTKRTFLNRPLLTLYCAGHARA